VQQHRQAAVFFWNPGEALVQLPRPVAQPADVQAQVVGLLRGAGNGEGVPLEAAQGGDLEEQEITRPEGEALRAVQLQMGDRGGQQLRFPDMGSPGGPEAPDGELRGEQPQRGQGPLPEVGGVQQGRGEPHQVQQVGEEEQLEAAAAPDRVGGQAPHQQEGGQKDQAAQAGRRAEKAAGQRRSQAVVEHVRGGVQQREAQQYVAQRLVDVDVLVQGQQEGQGAVPQAGQPAAHHGQQDQCPVEVQAGPRPSGDLDGQRRAGRGVDLPGPQEQE
jgi:hypothetical protein